MGKSTRQSLAFSAIALLLAAVLSAIYLQAAANRGPDTRQILVAGRDIGAGERLHPDNLVTAARPISDIPANVLVPEDLDSLRTRNLVLGSPRLAGEYIHVHHLQEAIELGASERGIMLSVDQVSGLSGLLRPGDMVGVVAVVHVEHQRDEVETYAKVLLEDLRVTYISPNFQRTLVQAASPNMSEEEAAAAAGDNDGVIMVAASLLPSALIYERQETLAHEGWARLIDRLPEADARRDLPNPYQDRAPTAVWTNQVELLTMLQGADASFVLYRQPPNAERVFSTTPGASIAQLLLPIQLSQSELVELYDIRQQDDG